MVRRIFEGEVKGEILHKKQVKMDLVTILFLNLRHDQSFAQMTMHKRMKSATEVSVKKFIHFIV